MAVNKAVSRKFHTVSKAKIEQLKKKTIKKRSLNKMMWGVRAYNAWRENRLTDFVNYDCTIFEVNLSEVSTLTKKKLEYAMCRFIPEVTKVKDNTDYPGRTLYQMCVSIQRYLNENGKSWKLVDGPDFHDLRVVLDNVMKERAAMNWQLFLLEY